MTLARPNFYKIVKGDVCILKVGEGKGPPSCQLGEREKISLMNGGK